MRNNFLLMRMEQKMSGDLTKGKDSYRIVCTSSTSFSDNSTSKSSVVMPTPPDGGYGWIIVFSVFLISVICDGVAYTLGIFYTRFLEVFQQSRSVTSWVQSIFYGISLIAAPLVAALVNKYGCRRISIWGGILCGLGLILSSFANSIEMLCFTLGIISGFGTVMEYVTTVVIVAFYFEKKRALATGLSFCGTGIGTFIFAPFVQLLIEEYDWRGTLLILGGISLNIVVFGALFRPIEFTTEEKYMKNLETFEKMASSVSKVSLQDHSTNQRRHIRNYTGKLKSKSSTGESLKLEHLRYSQVEIPTFVNNHTGLPDTLLMDARKDSNLQKLVQMYHQNYHILSACNDYICINSKNETAVVDSEKYVVLEGLHDTDHTTESNDHLRSDSSTTCAEKLNPVSITNQPQITLSKRNIFYVSLMKLSLVKMSSVSCPELHRKSFYNEEDDSCVWKLLRLLRRMRESLKTVFDLSILCNPFFVVFLFSNFILFFWTDVPYVFIVDRAIEVGIPEFKAAFIVSINGILNTIGQIAYGFLGDTNINLSLLYGASTMFCGVSLVFIPFFVEFVPIAFLTGAFGLFISANYVLSTVILVEYLGMDMLTNAYSLTMLIQGIANVIGPPVAGTLYDVSGDYDNTFYVGGVVMVLSGLLVAFVPVLKYIFKVQPEKISMKIKKETEGIEEEMNKLVSTKN